MDVVDGRLMGGLDGDAQFEAVIGNQSGAVVEFILFDWRRSLVFARSGNRNRQNSRPV